jgi:hypothetical protein
MLLKEKALKRKKSLEILRFPWYYDFRKNVSSIVCFTKKEDPRGFGSGVFNMLPLVLLI